MSRLLAVSWEMPPMYGPRAAQVSATLRELAVLGWAPSVVCLAPRRGGPHWQDGARNDPPPGVELVRVPSPEEWLVSRAARRLAPVLWRFPDDKRVWVNRAVTAARAQASRHAFRGLITFAQPWSDHLIGLRLRRIEHLPWVAHFSDPWVDSPYATGPEWQRRLSRQMERAVIEEADAVVFVTREAADLVMAKYPDSWRSKVAVVPHGYDPRGLNRGRSQGKAGPMRMLYTGRFYRGLRTPSALLRALASLHWRQSLAGTLELVLMGPSVEAYGRDVAGLGLDSIVRLEPRRPREEAARMAADADVLLVIDAPSAGPSVFLPSKLVDYLAFRKPILGLTPSPGAAANLLARLGFQVAPPDDEAAIAADLQALLERWRAGTLDVPPSFDEVAAEYDIRRTTAQLDAILHRTCRAA
jgi:Glycosyl transferase 4-like domain/Glycosyl transferases group 1